VSVRLCDATMNDVMIVFVSCRMQIEQDGSFNVIDSSSRAGRTFHGLGRQLTGYKVVSL